MEIITRMKISSKSTWKLEPKDQGEFKRVRVMGIHQKNVCINKLEQTQKVVLSIQSKENSGPNQIWVILI